MQSAISLKSIFYRFKWKILATFSLLTLENVFTVLLPFVMGLAINNLLEKSYNGLMIFAGVYMGRLIIGTLRRFYDTRAYTRIYTVVASETVQNHRHHKKDNSTTVTRANLVHELIEFFEQDLTMGFSSVVSVVGAMVMLAFFNLYLLLGCIIALLIIFMIYKFSERRIFNLNKGFNDELEKQVDIISHQPQPAVFKHFSSLARSTVKLSDLESINFGLIEFVLFGLAVFALIISVMAPNPTPGGIFSVLSYVLEFAGAIYMLPYIFQQIIRLQEISGRLNITSDENEQRVESI